MAEKEKEKTFREGMEPPANIEDMKTATPTPTPMTEQQRMGKVVIGTKADLPKGYVHRKEPNEGAPPVKKADGGAIKSASARADGICQRGKTRGKMV